MQEAFFQSEVGGKHVNVNHHRLCGDTTSMWKSPSTVCCRPIWALSALSTRFTWTLLQAHQRKVFTWIHIDLDR